MSNRIGWRWLLAVAIALSCTFAVFFTHNAEVASSRGSMVSGLATLKTMSQQTVPYETAISNQKPTLLEFYANWCTTCQAMAPLLERLHQRYGETVNVVMLNVDEPQWTRQIAQYGVTGVPQFTFLGRDRNPVETLVGNVPEAILSSMFEQLQAPSASQET